MNGWKIAKALHKAKQLVDIACDWNLDEVEIDGKMIRTQSLTKVFDDALAEVEETLGVNSNSA
jgi:hypothetical protein